MERPLKRLTLKLVQPNARERFLTAAKNGDWRTVQEMLKNGQNPNVRTPGRDMRWDHDEMQIQDYGIPAIVLATYKNDENHYNTVRVLLEDPRTDPNLTSRRHTISWTYWTNYNDNFPVFTFYGRSAN